MFISQQKIHTGIILPPTKASPAPLVSTISFWSMSKTGNIFTRSPKTTKLNTLNLLFTHIHRNTQHWRENYKLHIRKVMHSRQKYSKWMCLENHSFKNHAPTVATVSSLPWVNTTILCLFLFTLGRHWTFRAISAISSVCRTHGWWGHHRWDWLRKMVFLCKSCLLTSKPCSFANVAASWKTPHRWSVTHHSTSDSSRVIRRRLTVSFPKMMSTYGMTFISGSLKNWLMKGADRFRPKILLLSDACLATLRIDSGDTVRKKPCRTDVRIISDTTTLCWRFYNKFYNNY